MSRLKPFFLVAALVLMLVPAGAGIAGESEAGPELVAVKFHADWCGSCKAMGSAFEDLGAKLDSEPVLFVELDLTTTPKRTQAGYLMQAMGAGEVWDEHGGGTGFILLLNPDDMSVVGRLTKAMTFKEMVKAIGEARSAAA